MKLDGRLDSDACRFSHLDHSQNSHYETQTMNMQSPANNMSEFQTSHQNDDYEEETKGPIQVATDRLSTYGDDTQGEFEDIGAE